MNPQKTFRVEFLRDCRIGDVEIEQGDRFDAFEDRDRLVIRSISYRGDWDGEDLCRLPLGTGLVARF